MFASRDRRFGSRLIVDVAFTDRWGGASEGTHATLDLARDRPGESVALLRNRSLLAEAFEVDGFAMMHQVHGAAVCEVAQVDESLPECDALVTTCLDVALCVRVGDCVPLVLADPFRGVVAVAHAGRPGVVAGVVAATVQAMRDLGASELEAWVGPHVCGGCYEVPAAMRADVSRVEPAAFCCTTWGTPAVDIGAALTSQLRRAGVERVNASPTCTRESPDLFSYRRQGADSGRQGGLVVLRRTSDPVPVP